MRVVQILVEIFYRWKYVILMNAGRSLNYKILKLFSSSQAQVTWLKSKIDDSHASLLGGYSSASGYASFLIKENAHRNCSFDVGGKEKGECSKNTCAT